MDFVRHLPEGVVEGCDGALLLATPFRLAFLGRGLHALADSLGGSCHLRGSASPPAANLFRRAVFLTK